jgi:hypothetical protein
MVISLYNLKDNIDHYNKLIYDNVEVNLATIFMIKDENMEELLFSDDNDLVNSRIRRYK